ncbi:Protein of unknown function [Saccharopolyspora antimicrobica]|uniref:Uncharacterized protein DUF3515 n=1 Tax=Saccharopolyspora antimicrobica TaxID=455193 RepID=A0A1I4T8L8_9PSEU|nr:DUF3515 domain-containing protein [Saccharopolyspora antimicrobica]RKT85819.1 uncharacterized protein DUF3515 [Saccharopolyspora antimicrobica]SFM72943.1 Protein of unknown function [Saccharopolyspora antimicrobica]
MLIVAITLGALLALAVAGIGTYGWYSARQEQLAVEEAEQARRTGPLALAPIPAPEAESPECAAVVGALPRELKVGDALVPRRELAQPAPPATIAWGDGDHDPITVRCGIGAPAELTPTAQLVDVSGVSWLEINQGGDTSWLAVDRPVYVALSVPGGTGTGPLQDLSAILGEKLPKQPVFP